MNSIVELAHNTSANLANQLSFILEIEKLKSVTLMALGVNGSAFT
jgi:hypothetical protein